MTRYLIDVASYQGALRIADVIAGGFTAVNLKISHGLGLKSVHPDLVGWVTAARAAGMGISTFHFLTGEASGTAQAAYAYGRLVALGLVTGAVHQVDCESDANWETVRDYALNMRERLNRPVVLYTGDWWWAPKGWPGATLSPYLWSAPNAGYPGSYPGDTSAQWSTVDARNPAGWGGWTHLAVMQYAVGPITPPAGPAGTIAVSKSAIRDPAVWAALTGGGDMAWVLVPCGIALRNEFNEVAPGRDAASDGAVGNLAHQLETSDHNPDETGNTGGMSDADDTNEVHAIDVDDSGPWPAGWSMEKFVQFLLGECRAGREKRLRYIIYERRIWSASTAVPWSQQAYTGPNPHDKHAHFSFSYVTAQESDTSPYGLKELIEVAFADEKIPLKAAAGVELYDPDRPAGAPVDAHDVLQIGAIHAVRAANTGAALLKGQVAQAATLGLILAAARAADDDAAVVAQADRVIAAIQAVDVSEDVAEIRALLAAAGGSAELAPVLAKLDALPGVLLGRVAAAQQAAVDAIRSA